MNDPGALEERYVALTLEGVGLFGDDPARIRGHVDQALRAWSAADRTRLWQLLALRATGPGEPGPASRVG